MSKKIELPKIDSKTQKVIDQTIKIQKGLIATNIVTNELDEKSISVNQEPLDLKKGYKTTKRAEIRDIVKQICIGIVITVFGGLILYIII